MEDPKIDGENNLTPKEEGQSEKIAVVDSPAPGENKKRGFVIQEIITTESTYLERLKFAVEYVIKPLKEQRILSEEDAVKQFNFLESIFRLHSENRIEGSASQNLKFIQLFDAIAQNVKCYSDYLVNYEPAMQRRAHLLIYNRKFSEFIEKVEKDPHLQGQKLESLLILPVQRIPRYRLLLEQLLKYTPEGHEDFHTVNSALDKICALAMYNNEQIRARENLNKMMEIMLSIEPTSRIDLFSENDRKFIKEGTLLKQCRRRYKEFQFWLFTDQLLYGEMTPIGLYTLNRQISLAKCKVKLLEANDPDTLTAFILESPAKSFQIKAKDEPEKKEWFEVLSDAIEKRRLAFKDDQELVAPLWKPDTKSDNCDLCDARFTLIFRRHHCRNCGTLVCDNCSSKRFYLPHVEEKRPVRVCDPCYDVLNPSHSAKTESMNATTGGDSPEDSEEDEENALEQRRSVDEDALNDFNEFLQNNVNTIPQEPDVALPENILKSLPPPKPPKPGRATVVNFSPDTFTQSSTENISTKREPRATIASPSKTAQNKPAPRKSLLAGLTSTVLRPTGLLNSFGLGSSPTTNSPANLSQEAGNSKPVDPPSSSPKSKKVTIATPPPPPPPPQSSVSTGESSPIPIQRPPVPPRPANLGMVDNNPENPTTVGSPPNSLYAGGRRPRRTNVIVTPNPFLAELHARLEQEKQGEES